MSLQKSSKIIKTKEIEINQKCTLVLSQALLNKISLNHQFVPKNLEWSGVLIYSITSGSLNDIENCVITVDDMILMNIGTSGYTEYEFNKEDDYSFDTYCDALEAGKKLGHIHTHHSMKAYFSGVDVSELHENAPNHAFYLSLIVNYQDYTNWVAEIAIAGIEEKTGKIYRKSSFLNKTDLEEKNEYEEIDLKEEVLYRIPCEITVAANPILDRIKELTPKTQVKSYSQLDLFNNKPKDKFVYEYKENPVPILGVTDKIDFTESKDFYEELDFIVDSRRDYMYNLDAISTFLVGLLIHPNEEYFNNLRLEDILAQYDTLPEEKVQDYLEKIDHYFEDWILEFFELDNLTSLDLHCISEGIIRILQNPYSKYKNSILVLNLVSILNTFYTLNEEEVDVEEFMRLTNRYSVPL